MKVRQLFESQEDPPFTFQVLQHLFQSGNEIELIVNEDDEKTPFVITRLFIDEDENGKRSHDIHIKEKDGYHRNLFALTHEDDELLTIEDTGTRNKQGKKIYRLKFLGTPDGSFNL